MKNFYTTCPECGNPLNITEALTRAQEISKEKVLSNCLEQRIECDMCETKTLTIAIGRPEEIGLEVGAAKNKQPEERLAN